jgi:hypothetical protein
MSNNISFRANFLKHARIRKQDIMADVYKPHQVSVVELDRNNDDDLECLYNLSKKWEGKRVCAPQIYQEATKTYEYANAEKEHFIGITNQKEGYKKLNPDEMLGVAVFIETNTKENELTWLQVNPKTKFSVKENREYKKVGSGIIRYLKKAYPEKPIIVYPTEEAEKFYKKNGFKEKDKYDSSPLIWKA